MQTFGLAVTLSRRVMSVASGFELIQVAQYGIVFLLVVVGFRSVMMLRIRNRGGCVPPKQNSDFENARCHDTMQIQTFFSCLVTFTVSEGELIVSKARVSRMFGVTA